MTICDKCETDLFPASIYFLKVNDRNTRRRCEICSKSTIETPERRHWHCSGVFSVNFEHISHLVLVFLLLTLNMQMSSRWVLMKTTFLQLLNKMKRLNVVQKQVLMKFNRLRIIGQKGERE